MATLHLVKKIGNKDFYRSDVTYVVADMLEGSTQTIPATEIDKLINENFTDKIDEIVVHTADKMMQKFTMSEWLVTEAD